ncbi:MAG: ABC transporter permease [Thermoplasmataceae archaeon]
MMSAARETKVFVDQNLQFYLRTKRFIFFLILVALITVVIYSLIATKVVPVPSTAEGFDTFFFGFIADLVIIIGAFLGGDAMASDFSLKTGSFVLSQPVARASILMGRYLGALAVGAAIITLYYILGSLGMLYLYSGIPVLVGESYLLALLYVAAAIALGFLFSSMFKNGSTAIVTAIIVMLLVFSIVSEVLTLTKIEPWFILTYGGGVVTDILVTPYAPHLSTISSPGPRGFSVSTYTPYVWEGLLIMVGYLIISLVVSIVIYNRREI